MNSWNYGWLVTESTSNKLPIPVTILFGCTGCGKGSLARELALRSGAEVVSLDSMKVYRRMDIGTAKPDASVRAAIPHHLIDVAEPSEEFSVARFVEFADAAIQAIHERGRPILAVGGTALYIKALTEGLFEGPSADPEVREQLRARAEREGAEALHAELARMDPPAAERIHRNDLRRIVRALEVHQITGRPITAFQTQWNPAVPRMRPEYAFGFIGLRRELADQNHRTNQRVKHMIDAGLVEEVRRLLAEPAGLGNTARQAVGYAEIIAHFQGTLSLAEAVERIKINTRRLAKSQRTWFKRFRDVRWIDLRPDSTAAEVADGLAPEMTV